MTLTIHETNSELRRVDFCWPKPDTRIPAAQRRKPTIEGYVECEFIYFPQDELERDDELAEAGELTWNERIEKMVPVINGLPLENGETAHEFLARHKYGAVIRTAILEEYWLFVGEGRKGNSRRRRSR